MGQVVSLSTAWNSHRHRDGYAMLAEVAELGFEYVELSHGIRISLVPGVLRALEEGVVKASSTHNFCPLPTSVLVAAPNVYRPSALDHREYDQWMRHTCRSIDFASRTGARVLILHLGSVVFHWFNPLRRINRRLKEHSGSRPPEDLKYQKSLDAALEKVRRRKIDHWKRVQEGVKAVLPYAAKKEVRLGLENREKLDELPLDEDWPEFIGALPEDAMAGYWHDVGHAGLKERMGVINHRRHLEAVASRLIGFHIHDVTPEGRDHVPLGTGFIDLSMIAEFFRPEHLFVLEFGPRVSRDAVRESRDKLLNLL